MQILALHKASVCQQSLLAQQGFATGAGFIVNWWTGVEILHNMFVKEHNAVCAMLRDSHGEMDEEQLHQTARLVIAGVLAKIHTTEWTPALLNNELMNVSMHQNWCVLPDLAAPS